jgi:archaellum component FlaC
VKEKEKSRARRSLLALAILLALAPHAAAQEVIRDRPSRRVTNPVRGQTPPVPATQEPRLVSTADDPAQETAPRRTTQRRAGGRATEQAAPGEQEQMRRTVNQLSQQVERLTDELTQMKSDQRVLFDLERLNRAEQRAENLRTQLREVTDKEFQFQDRLAQIEDEIQPDAIQRRAAVFGTLNPGAVRDQIQASLDRERTRIRRQLELVTNSRSRLEAAVATAEQEVERLRQRVEAADQPQTDAQNADPSAPRTTTTTTTPPDEQTNAQPPN